MFFDDPEQELQELPLAEEVVQEPTPPPVVQEAPKEVASAERNLRALREKAERIERERDEALKRLQELEAKASSRDDFEINLGEDELAEGKHLRKVSGKLKKVEEQLAAIAQQTKAVSLETRLKQQYPDIEQVVTPASIEQLKEQYPEVAATIASSADEYSKAATAYTLIKKFGIVPDRQVLQERERAATNFNKPRPLASISPQQGDSPLSHANAFANGLTDELKAQLHREMLEAIRNR